MSILLHGAAVPAVLSPVRLSELPIPMVELVGADRRDAMPGDVGAAGSELAERATAPLPALGAAPAPPAPQAVDDRVAAPIDERDALRSRLNAQMVERGAFLSQLDAGRAERDVLRERLDAQRAERARPDEQVAELTAETRALTSQLADGGRRADRLAVSLAERDTAEQAAIQEMRQAHDELFAALREEITAKDVSLRRAREGLAVSIVDRVLFPSGQAALTPDGREILDRVAGVLATTSTHRIIIEGHTDDVPIGGALRARFPTNWEL